MNHLKTGAYIVAVLQVSKQLCMYICTSHTVHAVQQGPVTWHNTVQLLHVDVLQNIHLTQDASPGSMESPKSEL